MNDKYMLEGYMDGLRDDRVDYPTQSNRSESYAHGWRNGRDDRLGKPRAAAGTIRQAALRATVTD